MFGASDTYHRPPFPLTMCPQHSHPYAQRCSELIRMQAECCIKGCSFRRKTTDTMLQVLLTLALYDGDPFVKSPHSFSDIGPHSTSYVALEFYAGWCGHCQAFAPTWKEVARHACAAAPRLQFVAVDCASDFLLCQEMQVPSFPTIRLFGPRLPALGHELSTCLHGCKTSAETLDEVVHLVREVAPSALPAHSSTELAGLSERSSCATEAQTVGYQTPG